MNVFSRWNQWPERKNWKTNQNRVQKKTYFVNYAQISIFSFGEAAVGRGLLSAKFTKILRWEVLICSTDCPTKCFECMLMCDLLNVLEFSFETAYRLTDWIRIFLQRKCFFSLLFYVTVWVHDLFYFESLCRPLLF